MGLRFCASSSFLLSCSCGYPVPHVPVPNCFCEVCALWDGLLLVSCRTQNWKVGVILFEKGINFNLVHFMRPIIILQGGIWLKGRGRRNETAGPNLHIYASLCQRAEQFLQVKVSCGVSLTLEKKNHIGKLLRRDILIYIEFFKKLVYLLSM